MIQNCETDETNRFFKILFCVTSLSCSERIAQILQHYLVTCGGIAIFITIVLIQLQILVP